MKKEKKVSSEKLDANFASYTYSHNHLKPNYLYSIHSI